jgi:hypothetical protein
VAERLTSPTRTSGIGMGAPVWAVVVGEVVVDALSGADVVLLPPAGVCAPPGDAAVPQAAVPNVMQTAAAIGARRRDW